MQAYTYYKNTCIKAGYIIDESDNYFPPVNRHSANAGTFTSVPWYLMYCI